MTMFLAPYTAIADIDGSPLDAGFLFFGEYGKDPELFPIEVFWDSDFTVPAVQPIRTRNGYPVRNGSPTKVYLKTAQHSIVIKNRNSAIILVDFKNKGWDASFVVDGNETQHQINNSLIRIVSNKTDLLTISNPRNKQVVYVVENEKRYSYDPNLTAADNGVTVIGKWEMEIQEAYYASWFCQAESGIDESVKLQTGYDYAVSKKRAFIVDIKVDVDPVRVGDNKVGLWVRSNSVLGFIGGGEIRMLTNNSTHYDVIRVQDVENYIINNPVLRGDRRTHTGTGGEWGYGLTVYQSKNGYIHKPRIYDMWGDGLYVGRIWGLDNSTTPTNVTVFKPYIEGIRRNGIAFTAGNNVDIVRPYITKVGDYDGVVGAWPKAGIDIEPEQAASSPLSSIVNSRIVSATIKDCYAGIYGYFFSSNLHHSLVFEGDTIIDGANNTAVGLFHGGSNCTGLIHFEHIITKPPHYIGLHHGWNGASSLKCVVDKLTISGSATFEIKHVLNGAFVEKELGNLYINNIVTSVSVFQALESNVDGYKLGYVFRRNPDSTGSLYFFGSADISFKPSFVLDGTVRHTGYSSSTKAYPNTIWQDPSVDTTGTVAIYLNTSGDYRRLKIGLHPNTSIVGMGCNIQGLNLVAGGATKTTAKCTTLGGWIELQNVAGGRTVIYDSYGEWTFG